MIDARRSGEDDGGGNGRMNAKVCDEEPKTPHSSRICATIDRCDRYGKQTVSTRGADLPGPSAGGDPGHRCATSLAARGAILAVSPTDGKENHGAFGRHRYDFPVAAKQPSVIPTTGNRRPCGRWAIAP